MGDFVGGAVGSPAGVLLSVESFGASLGAWVGYPLGSFVGDLVGAVGRINLELGVSGFAVGWPVGCMDGVEDLSLLNITVDEATGGALGLIRLSSSS